MTNDETYRVHEGERLRRWRMVLGAGDKDYGDATGVELGGDDNHIDAALSVLYDAPPTGQRRGSGTKRAAGLGASAPNVARWLGDIRRYFPTDVVQVMQRDAIDRLNLHRLLLEPEMLSAVEPDIHLVTTLLALQHLLPETTRATARIVVSKVVEQLEQRLAQPTLQAVRGALSRSARTSRPRHQDIDWNRTVRANLAHYQPSLHTVIPHRLIGYTRQATAMRRELIIAVDQSASMADSVVYASVFAAALGSLRALKTHLVVFDTAVCDLTDQLHDPIELLFGIQLGGGTDINQALSYCQSVVTVPNDTVVVLISDLYEGSTGGDYVSRAIALARSGVTVVVLLALNDQGAPSFDQQSASALAEFGIPSFACTPAAFPDLLAAALERRDLHLWAGASGLATRP